MIKRVFGNLAVDFGLLLLLAALVALLGLVGLKRVEADYRQLINHSFEIERLAAKIETDLLHAQNRAEQFELYLESDGFEAAYEAYFVPHNHYLASLLQDTTQLAKLVAASDNPEDRSILVDVEKINQDITRYQQDYDRLVEILKERGTTTSGREGAFRQKAAQIETLLAAHPQEKEVQLALLQLRLAEEEYLLHHSAEQADQVRLGYHQLVGQIEDSAGIPRREKNEIEILLDSYDNDFERVVEVDEEIEPLRADIELLISDIEQRAMDVDDLGRQEATDQMTLAQRATAQTIEIVTISAIVVTIFGVGLTAALYWRSKREQRAALPEPASSPDTAA